MCDFRVSRVQRLEGLKPSKRYTCATCDFRVSRVRYVRFSRFEIILTKYVQTTAIPHNKIIKENPPT